MKVKIERVPAVGATLNSEGDAKDGETLGQFLTRNNIGTKGFNVLLNGEPAKLDEPISAHVKLVEQATVTVTERPRGS